MVMDDDAPLGHDHKPLSGVVLCCTSLPQDVRTSVADIAQELGAKHQLDLISDTTHLIVGNVMTPKYQYVAKERPDIVVLHADFIQAVRDAWTSGEDVDVPALEEKHRLPTFFGLRICLTGFADADERNQIARTISDAGAQYDGDLTRSVTHLIAHAPSGPKYTHAMQWGVKVVSLKWMTDSVERRMALDEKFYDLSLPSDEQGKGAWRTKRKAKPTTNLGKRSWDSSTGVAATEELGKRKLRRTASSRLTGHSQSFLDGISGHESVAETNTNDQWAEASASRIDNANSPSESGPRHEVSSQPVETSSVQYELILSGCYVLVSGFEEKKHRAILGYLEPNGATVVTSADELAQASQNPGYRCRFVLVPHARPSGTIDLPEAPPDTKIVSEWWLERCVQRKRMLDSSQDVLSQPLWDPEIAGFIGLTISSSGFDGTDLRQLSQAIDLTGARYCERVSSSLSVLISGSSNLKKEKAMYASKYNIPVVKADWIWKCLRTRTKVPLDEHLIRLPAYDASQLSTNEASASTPLPTEPLPRKPVDASKTKENSTKARLSNTRTRNTPTLSMQPSKLSMSHTVSKPSTPFIYQDEEDEDDAPPQFQDEEGLLDNGPRKSLPLEERSVNASPRKSSAELSGDEAIKVAKQTGNDLATIDEVVPPAHSAATEADDGARRAQELHARLAALSKIRTATPIEEASNGPQLSKRKIKALGRNLSGSFGLHRTASMDSEHVLSKREGSQESILTPDDHTSEASLLLPPGTQIGYENPDAEQHRRTLEKSMKINLRDSSVGTRLPSVGIVKDSDLDYASAHNTTRSHRAHKRGR